MLSIFVIHSQTECDSTIILSGDPTFYINPNKSYLVLDPGGHSNYNPNVGASVTLISEDNSPIYLCCKKLGLSSGDYVEVYDGTNVFGELLFRFDAGSPFEAVLVCNTGSCFILFNSSSTNGAEGFEFFVNLSTVYNIETTEVNSRNATLVWEDSDPSVKEWEVRYKPNNLQGQWTTIQTNDTYVTLSDLESNTWYIVYINSPATDNGQCQYLFHTICDVANYNYENITDSCYVFRITTNIEGGEWTFTLFNDDTTIVLSAVEEGGLTFETMCGVDVSQTYQVKVSNSIYENITLCSDSPFGGFTPPCEKHTYGFLVNSVSSDGFIVSWQDDTEATSWTVNIKNLFHNINIDTVVYGKTLNIENLPSNTTFTITIENNLEYTTDNPCSPTIGFATTICEFNNITIFPASNFTPTSADLCWVDELEVDYWYIDIFLEDTNHFLQRRIVDTNCITLDSLLENGNFVVRITDSISFGHKCSWRFIEFSLPCAENIGCVDYTEVSSCRAKPTYGTILDPDKESGAIDYGFEDIESRHTVVWDTTARDARTGYQLRMVPEGYDASVRLGNWKAGMEAEKLTYKMKVDTSISDLLILKYAAILENPDHNYYEQPKFTIKLFDYAMREVNPRCYSKAFVANGNNDYNVYLWHDTIMLDGTPYDSVHYVMWKDWETVSMNLDEFHGEDIYIRLITYDCAKAGHFGYAYFALDCGKKDIISDGCGDVTASVLVAPEGFDYAWYNVDDVWNILSQDRVFYPPTPGNYECRAMSKGSNTCYVTIPATVTSKYPHADFSADIVGYKDCKILLQLTNASYITSDPQGNDIIDEGLSSVKWTLIDGEHTYYLNDRNPNIILDEGDYIIKVSASISEGYCEDSIEKNIHLVYPKADTTIYRTICEGESYLFTGLSLNTQGCYVANIQTSEGCDSTVNLHLFVNKVYNDTIIDTIEYGSVYNKNNFYENEPGIYYQHHTSIGGCDSNVVLILEVNSMYLVTLPTAITPREDNVKNAYFRIYTDYDIVEIDEYKIFNRWGTLVFEGKNITDYWDGKYKGKFVQQDAYVYKIVYHSKFSPNKQFLKTGNFMVVY